MNEDKYKIHVLGCRGSMTVDGPEFDEFGHATSCYVLKKGKYALIIDCGTGLYNAREVLKDCEVIDVYFTHVHYDHILGLLNFTVFPQSADVHFYGAFENWLGKDTIKEFFRGPFWPIQPNLGELVVLNPNKDKYELHNGIVVESMVSLHPNHANLLKIYIDGKVVIVLFDCEDPYYMPISMSKNADMILFDGMYTDELYDQHVGWGHATYQNGCKYAKEAGIKRVIICHHDPNNTDAVLRKYEQKAKKLNENAFFARQGDIYEL